MLNETIIKSIIKNLGKLPKKILNSEKFLTIMIQNNDIFEIVEQDYLIKHFDKFDISIDDFDSGYKDEYGNTILHFICRYIKDFEIVKYSMDKFKDIINEVNYYGENILHIACVYNTNEVIKYIMKFMDINQESCYGETIDCLLSDNLEMIKEFVKNDLITIEHVSKRSLGSTDG